MHSGDRPLTNGFGARSDPKRSLIVMGLLVAALVGLLLPSGFAYSGDRSTGLISSASGSAIRPASLPTPIQHVFEIMMENEGTGVIVGTGGQPYENGLANTYAWAGTSYYAMCHPSAPNYLALSSGQTLQCGSDAYNSYGVNNIGNLLQTQALSWVAYAESMPSACATHDSGNYAVRHNPIAYYSDLSGTCAAHDLPIANLVTSYPYSTTPPAWTYIAPNLLNDGHDTGAAYGDNWLSTFIPKLIAQPWFASTVIFIVYDECANQPNCKTGPGGGPVALLAVSPFSQGVGALSATNNHLNLLSTQEWLLGLPCTGSGGDCSAAPITGLFNFGNGSAPLASAGASPSSGVAPLPVQFTGSASGGSPPYGYAWSFGDGARSTLQSPAHTYASPGNYTASLTVNDSAGKQGTASVRVSVTNSSGPLIASASSNTSRGAAPLAVQFSGGASGGSVPYTYSWTFGDGASASVRNPAHTYALPGNFTAMITVIDGVGSHASSSILETVTTSGPLRTNATANVTQGPAPLFVKFFSSPSGGTPPYLYNWSFGDGSYSAHGWPSHEFVSNGNFSVVPRASEANGTSATALLSIRVGPGLTPLTIAPTGTPANGNAPLTVQFQSAAHGGVSPYTYAWAFADGGGSTASAPQHTYSTPGTYDSTLQVTDNSGAEVRGTLLITVNSAVGALNGTLAANATWSLASAAVQFTSALNGGSPPYLYLWNFGDGDVVPGPSNVSHVFHRAGVFNVSVTASDSLNRTWTGGWVVHVFPTLMISLTVSPSLVTPGEAVGVSAKATGGSGGTMFAWTLNGGPYGGNVSSFRWVPANPGSFTFQVTIRQLHGIEGSDSLKVTVAPAGVAYTSGFSWVTPGVGAIAVGSALVAILFVATSAIVVVRQRANRRWFYRSAVLALESVRKARKGIERNSSAP